MLLKDEVEMLKRVPIFSRIASSSGAMKIRDSGRTSDRSRIAHFESREVEIRGAWIFS